MLKNSEPVGNKMCEYKTEHEYKTELDQIEAMRQEDLKRRERQHSKKKIKRNRPSEPFNKEKLLAIASKQPKKQFTKENPQQYINRLWDERRQKSDYLKDNPKLKSKPRRTIEKQITWIEDRVIQVVNKRMCVHPGTITSWNNLKH